jgi:hypothetical protein
MDGEALRARLLGPMDLRFGERQLPPLPSARAESLLGYLLLHHDAPQPRQRLAFLLWPGSTERQAQTNLRKVLHTLRRALPGADSLIEVGPRTLRWRADAPLWLDVEHFERVLAEGRLGDAVETYTGERLEGGRCPVRSCVRWSAGPAALSGRHAAASGTAGLLCWRGWPGTRQNQYNPPLDDRASRRHPGQAADGSAKRVSRQGDG